MVRQVDHPGDGILLAEDRRAVPCAAAATVSAAAIANRADTPERWSIDCDSRSARANRARICSR